MIDKTLKHYQIPQHMIELILTIYRDNKAYLMTPHGKTTVRSECGVKQGDTLSPILFILFINPLLRALKETGEGYKMGKHRNIQTNISYVDELK